MPHELRMKSLRLFGERVLPKLKLDSGLHHKIA